MPLLIEKLSNLKLQKTNFISSKIATINDNKIMSLTLVAYENNMMAK